MSNLNEYYQESIGFLRNSTLLNIDVDLNQIKEKVVEINESSSIEDVGNTIKWICDSLNTEMVIENN